VKCALKDNINEMIRNLNDTTLKNSEQIGSRPTWPIRRMLQGQKDLLTVGRLILSELAPWSRRSTRPSIFWMRQGACRAESAGQHAHKGQDAVASIWPWVRRRRPSVPWRNRRSSLPTCLPINPYFSGLGSAPPQNILVLPVVFEGQSRASWN